MISTGSDVTSNAPGATARLLRSALIRLTPEGVPEQDSLLAPLIEVLEAERQMTRSKTAANTRGARDGTARGHLRSQT